MFDQYAEKYRITWNIIMRKLHISILSKLLSFIWEKLIFRIKDFWFKMYIKKYEMIYNVNFQVCFSVIHLQFKIF